MIWSSHAISIASPPPLTRHCEELATRQSGNGRRCYVEKQARLPATKNRIRSCSAVPYSQIAASRASSLLAMTDWGRASGAFSVSLCLRVMNRQAHASKNSSNNCREPGCVFPVPDALLCIRRRRIAPLRETRIELKGWPCLARGAGFGVRLGLKTEWRQACRIGLWCVGWCC